MSPPPARRRNARSRRRGIAAVAAVGLTVGLVAACGASTNNAAAPAIPRPPATPPPLPLTAKPTAVITLGDSYISGEAGRWNGNSMMYLASRRGTDRAWVYDRFYDPKKVYGGSHTNGCNRSDVSESLSSTIGVDVRLNIACSGATTPNIWSASAHGVPFKGERPQADQLADLVGKYDVKAVVLSIGGNDLGFADIIKACVIAFSDPRNPKDYRCHGDQQKVFDSKLKQAAADVGKAIDQVKAAMTISKYAPDSYKFIFQSYPSPLPVGAQNRYKETYWDRLVDGGCPLYNDDMTWARTSLVSQIANTWKGIAANKQVQFLDLRDVGNGHEVCAKGVQQSEGRPRPVQMEWFRFLTPTGTEQGQPQESFHPNAYGQQVLGRCLNLVYAQTGPAYACTNTPGKFLDGIAVTPTS